MTNERKSSLLGIVGILEPAPHRIGEVTVLTPEQSRSMAAFLAATSPAPRSSPPNSSARLLTPEEAAARPDFFSRWLQKNKAGEP